MKPNQFPADLILLCEQIKALMIEFPCKIGLDSRRAFNKEIAKRFDYIGSGAFRLVYGAKAGNREVVIKIPHHDQRKSGWAAKDIREANGNEFDACVTVADEFPLLAALILPPLAFLKYGGHEVLIFDKVQVIGDMDDDDVCDIRNEDYVFDKSCYFVRRLFQDAHNDNIGIYNGLPVMIDFSFGRPNMYDDERQKAEKFLRAHADRVS